MTLLVALMHSAASTTRFSRQTPVRNRTRLSVFVALIVAGQRLDTATQSKVPPVLLGSYDIRFMFWLQRVSKCWLVDQIRRYTFIFIVGNEFISSYLRWWCCILCFLKLSERCELSFPVGRRIRVSWFERLFARRYVPVILCTYASSFMSNMNSSLAVL